MRYRQFGKTDLRVSETGFGAWAIGGGAMIGNTAIGWGEVDDALSKKAIYTALDQGINFFDTADIYGLGHSEEILGATLKGRQDVIIASKVGNVARDGQFTTDYSPDYMVQACEESLRRLQRETIDYYQLHTARIKDLESGAVIGVMDKLKQQGKIRYWGISLNTFEPHTEADYLMNLNKGDGFQLVFNLINQKALSLIEAASKKGYGVIARMPLQFGLLTGKFDTGVEFADNDHRKGRLTPEVVEASNTYLRPVWDLCAKYNCTKTELAMSFILSHKEISTVIPGIRTPEQAIQNTTGLFQLTLEELDQIHQLGTTGFRTLMELIRKQG